MRRITADETEIPVPCYPIETVTRFELKSTEPEGWIEQPTTPYLVRRSCVISLASPLGTAAQQARLTYTGGFVPPGATPGPGQTPLPADLEQAAVEQVAAWYQNRDKLGLKTIWAHQGSYMQFLQSSLLPAVKAVLVAYQRWTL